MGWNCNYCYGGMYEDHKTCNDILVAREENEGLSARVEELERLTANALAAGCQRYRGEASRWAKKGERASAVCWEFDEGSRRPCAVCALAKQLQGGDEPRAWRMAIEIAITARG